METSVGIVAGTEDGERPVAPDPSAVGLLAGADVVVEGALGANPAGTVGVAA